MLTLHFDTAVRKYPVRRSVFFEGASVRAGAPLPAAAFLTYEPSIHIMSSEPAGASRGRRPRGSAQVERQVRRWFRAVLSSSSAGIQVFGPCRSTCRRPLAELAATFRAALLPRRTARVPGGRVRDSLGKLGAEPARGLDRDHPGASRPVRLADRSRRCMPSSCARASGSAVFTAAAEAVAVACWAGAFTAQARRSRPAAGDWCLTPDEPASLLRRIHPC